MINKPLVTILFVVFSYTLTPNCFSQETEKEATKKDSTTSTTPFRKGRWITGLTGFISTGSNENTSTLEKTTSNRYRIEVNTGKFIKDRINIGLSANMERSNFEDEDISESTSETFFIGPKGTYYFSGSNIGSLFYSLSPGYVIYRETLGNSIEDTYVESLNKGGGFGFLSTFGFSYVIHDRVSFELGLNYNLYWLDLELSNNLENHIEHTTFEQSNLSFSFGFKILLDKKPI